MKNYRIIQFSYLGVLIFLLISSISACRNDEPENPIDDSFLTGQPCQPPCWHGLEPGKSSYGEARNTLNTLDFINQERIWEREDSTGSFLEYSCVNSGSDLCGSLYFDTENILQSILIYQPFDLSIAQIIEILGKPDGYQIGDYNVGCEFRVYWLTLNISGETFITPDRDSKCDRFFKGDLNQELKIEWLNYSTFQPSEADLITWPMSPK